MLRNMLVLTTGDPVPAMLEARGPFSNMIAAAARGAYEGPIESIDARTSLPETPPDGAFIVITGSSAYVTERDPWVLKTEAFLRDVVARGVPVLGICFGHQLLAQALGGEVVKNPRGREIGSVHIDVTGGDPILDGVPERFIANVTHLETVGTPPPGATILARSSRDDHQILRFNATTYGVQFHPELDPFIMHGYLEARRPILELEGLDVDAHKEKTTDAPFAVKVLENFIRLATVSSLPPPAGEGPGMGV